MAATRIISIIGLKNAGKTTFLVALAAELVRRKFRVMTLKHGSHPADMDQKGKDTWRHWHEGKAERVLMEGPGQRVLFERTTVESDPITLARRYLGGADIVLADDAKWLRDRLTANGVPDEAIEKHLAVLGNKDAMEAALAWYRARGAIRGPLGPIRVPTLYVWGDADDTVGRAAAEGTVDFIAAPYRFEVLAGVGHFAADQAGERVCELMLEHLAAHPV